jgi:hypothetical protein
LSEQQAAAMAEQIAMAKQFGREVCKHQMIFRA